MELFLPGVAATVSYRLSDVAPFPAAGQDVKCAVRWLRAATNDQAFQVMARHATEAPAPAGRNVNSFAFSQLALRDALLISKIVQCLSFVSWLDPRDFSR